MQSANDHNMSDPVLPPPLAATVKKDAISLRTENDRLQEENLSLRQTNDILKRQVEELRSLRDRGLLHDLKAASPEDLYPSEELMDMCARLLPEMHARIDEVLKETEQRKFTVIDRDQVQREPASSNRMQTSNAQV
ncbi:unnamed protein product [Peniophora sp. CBMAI 1063]|nr:unnamed protein product [Peniophora sp. CBMAI 1063]